MPLARHLSFRLLQRLGPQVSVRLGARTLLVPTHDAAALAWIHWHPSWKSTLIGHLLPRRPGAFVDVGANAGQTLADHLALGVARPYVGFEPNPACAAFIDRIVTLNRLADVTLVPAAAGARQELHALFVAADSSTDQTATLRDDLRAARRRRTWIATVALDDALAAVGHREVALLKIDVEGYEREVLAGAARLLSTGRPPILCEVLRADPQEDFVRYRERIAVLRDLLHAHGYRLFQIEDHGHSAMPGLREVERFPEEIWSAENASACDYLFVPQEFDLREPFPTVAPRR
ncbi:MAG: hypothetical protein C0502_00355 [Opitutus sp.]|nr:hypothetical protein [Opitutus sp.]